MMGRHRDDGEAQKRKMKDIGENILFVITLLSSFLLSSRKTLCQQDRILIKIPSFPIRDFT